MINSSDLIDLALNSPLSMSDDDEDDDDPWKGKEEEEFSSTTIVMESEFDEMVKYYQTPEWANTLVMPREWEEAVDGKTLSDLIENPNELEMAMKIYEIGLGFLRLFKARKVSPSMRLSDLWTLFRHRKNAELLVPRLFSCIQFFAGLYFDTKYLAEENDFVIKIRTVRPYDVKTTSIMLMNRVQLRDFQPKMFMTDEFEWEWTMKWKMGKDENNNNNNSLNLMAMNGLNQQETEELEGYD